MFHAKSRMLEREISYRGPAPFAVGYATYDDVRYRDYFVVNETGEKTLDGTPGTPTGMTVFFAYDDEAVNNDDCVLDGWRLTYATTQEALSRRALALAVTIQVRRQGKYAMLTLAVDVLAVNVLAVRSV